MDPVTLPTLFRGRDEPLVRLLERPPELREGGFDLDVGEPPRILRGEMRRAVVPERMVLECWPDGTLVFAAEAEDFLCWGTQRRPGAPLRINPLALAESTYLFAELAREVYEHAEPRPAGVEFTLTLYRIDPGGEPARLTPGGLKSAGFRFAMDMRRAPDGTAEFIERLEAGWTPGEAAYLLVAKVYTWFGFEEDAVPYVVEEGGKRAISPDRIRADGG